MGVQVVVKAVPIDIINGVVVVREYLTVLDLDVRIAVVRLICQNGILDVVNILDRLMNQLIMILLLY